jgi:hypothetical protein
MTRKGWLLVVPLAGALLAQLRIEQALGPFRAQEEVLYVWSGDHLRRMLPGFESLMSDVYWIRTVQYYGGQRVFAKDKRFDLLKPLAEITTTLDPKFEIAYRYAAVFLSEPPPAGAGDAAAGVALLKKGVLHNPENWVLWQNLGYFQFLYLGDARGAAESLLEGSRRPGAPVWLGTLAGDMLREGGEREAARKVWRGIQDSAEAARIREIAQINLLRLDALDRIDDLNRVVADSRNRNGRNPAAWPELAAAGISPGLALDPLGHRFDYDGALGRFSIARTSRLWSSSLRSGGR